MTPDQLAECRAAVEAAKASGKITFHPPESQPVKRGKGRPVRLPITEERAAHNERQRDWMRKRIADLKEKGLCQRCGDLLSGEPGESKRICRPCRKKEYDQQAASKARMLKKEVRSFPCAPNEIRQS